MASTNASALFSVQVMEAVADASAPALPIEGLLGTVPSQEERRAGAGAGAARRDLRAQPSGRSSEVALRSSLTSAKKQVGAGGAGWGAEGK